LRVIKYLEDQQIEKLISDATPYQLAKAGARAWPGARLSRFGLIQFRYHLEGGAIGLTLPVVFYSAEVHHHLRAAAASGLSRSISRGGTHMRSTIALCAGLIAAVALAAPQASAQGGKRVAFLDGPIADKYIGGMTRSFNDTAKAAGLEVSVVQSPFDPALQAQQLDDAIAKKSDVIVLMIMSQKALIPALTRAKEAHIPVVLINTPIPETELFTAFVGEDSHVAGATAAEAMAEGLKDRASAKVAIIAGSMDEGIAPARVVGFKDEMAKHPGISVVAVEETHWAPPEAERATGQLLARFSSQGGLDGIYAMNDPMANGAVQAAQSAGVKLGTGKGELVVVGGNCLAMGIQDIEQGTMYATIYWTPINLGRDTAQTVEKILAGQTVPKRQSRGVDIITKANVEKYKAECTF
jgi:ABC-type sugar transport system substrate-binding protein